MLKLVKSTFKSWIFKKNILENIEIFVFDVGKCCLLEQNFLDRIRIQDVNMVNMNMNKAKVRKEKFIHISYICIFTVQKMQLLHAL